MSRSNEVGKHATVIFTENGIINIIYHSTKVVRFNHQTIILNSGGYRTNTTKVRMNQASKQYDLGFTVYQKNFEWFVTFNGTDFMFADGMTIDRRLGQVSYL